MNPWIIDDSFFFFFLQHERTIHTSALFSLERSYILLFQVALQVWVRFRVSGGWWWWAEFGLIAKRRGTEEEEEDSQSLETLTGFSFVAHLFSVQYISYQELILSVKEEEEEEWMRTYWTQCNDDIMAPPHCSWIYDSAVQYIAQIS